jgi:diguanylate cyclase (GGDEF)-like protein
MLFVGTLSPKQITKVAEYRLTMSDFGPFDVSADFAMMAQVNEAVLKDTRLLNESLAAARDEAVRARKKIEAVALVDSLSGLANRAAFQHALEAAGRDAEPRSLLLLDVDDFKPVNDQYGHAVGDQLIRSLGERIAGAADGNACAFRIGGDEFAVIFRKLTPVQAKHHAKSVIRAVQAPHAIQAKRISVSASGGLASRMFGLNDLESLYKAADVALYEAKRSSNRKLQIFTTGMGRRELDKKLLDRDLMAAVRQCEMEIFVQPQYDLATGVLTGGEALARWWNQRLQRYVPPDVFIPIAEAYGLVAQIDLLVFAGVLREQNALGIAARSITWCTNFSAVTIGLDDLTRRLEALIAEHGPLTAPTEIEITESAILREAGAIGANLQSIRASGIDVAIDDFGAGQTSLSHLTRLPITRMKLDRSLVERIDKDERAETIARSIVTLAHQLGLRVTAEGIERPSQADRLRRMGPMTAQGFLYATPLPMAEFLARVSGNAEEGVRVAAR